uniref:Striatin, calmodulin binding protein 3 n=1 Tax=Acanthochromis polyacanthus TaxID=80966 RepID=A0A3Q1G0M0_9TELE
ASLGSFWVFQGASARIAFLQGERKGQENLKNDLVRRIKMLEYALKQERAKYHKLKYGTELNQGEMKMPSFESGQNSEVSAVPANSQLTWKQGRQLLRQ